MDRAWWRRHHDEVAAAFDGECITGSERCPGARTVHFERGGNSGIGALSLAAHWGAERIILLGYDCQYGADGRRHWHGNHPRGLGNAVSLPKWPQQFEAAAGRLRHLEILNASRATALRCWPRRTLEDALATPTTTVRGMRGLGDNIYQRAFVRQLPGQVYVDTPWPELYQDLPNVRCLEPSTTLRTQAKNARRHHDWAERPTSGRSLKVSYGAGIFAGMRASLGVDPAALDLPDFGASPVAGAYAVVRPVTVRREWRAESRNPRPEYVAEAAAELRARGLQVVSVADLAAGHEWALDPLPTADIRYHRGELPVERLLALIQGARLVVGGIGWLVPAALAAGVPAWIIAGGNGGYNAPELITPPGPHSVRFALPDRFCRCRRRCTRCDKTITGHLDQFKEWANEHLGEPDLVA